MARKSKLKFPIRINPSIKDDLEKQKQEDFPASTGGGAIYGDWNDIFRRRPFDIPFFTALNSRACILIYFSAQSIPEPDVIEEVLKSQRPWTLHVAAFLKSSYPILRCNIIFPDNPQSPYYLEAPMNLKSGNVQDFCCSVLEDECVDIILKHELLKEKIPYYSSAFRGRRLSSLMRKELKEVLKNLNPAATIQDFEEAVAKMNEIISSAFADIDRKKCVQLDYLGEARNRIIKY